MVAPYTTQSMMIAQMNLQTSYNSLRQFSILNREERKQEEQNKAFKEDIEYFLSKNNFDIFDFHERVLVSTN